LRFATPSAALGIPVSHDNMRSDSMKSRDRKKHAQRRRQEQVRLEKKERLERVLSALGLLKGFRELPGPVRAVAIRSLPGRPRVVISPTARRSPALEEAKNHIEQALGGATMGTEDGKSFPLLDFLSAGCTLPGFFSSLVSAPLSQKQHAFVEHAAKIATAFLKDRVPATVDWLGKEVLFQLMPYSRIDSQLLGGVLEEQHGLPGTPLWQLVLHSSEPREIRVEIDGKSRRAFQGAVPWQLEGIRWLECDGGPLGLDSGRMYPVFLQSHALHRLRERLASSRMTEVALQLGLMCSVAEPTLGEKQGDSYLIAYHLRGIRVGYLVAQVIEDRLIVTTFLFLTMEGTPEGRLLKRKLRLTLPDIKYGGLDRLETFLAPDVLADKDLVKVLEESGCGSLLALARDGFPHTAVEGHAEELKKFLRITDGEDQKLSRRRCSPRARTR
jgi:hypothetical protein